MKIKLFQLDQKVWEDLEAVDTTWQFFCVNEKTLLWAHLERPGAVIQGRGGLSISLNILTSSTPFGVSFNFEKFSFSLFLFTDYFKGW